MRHRHTYVVPAKAYTPLLHIKVCYEEAQDFHAFIIKENKLFCAYYEVVLGWSNWEGWDG